MHIESLKEMKHQIMSCVQEQLNHIDCVNTHELGEAIDMIKDLSEAIYYCTITESMQKVDQEEEWATQQVNMMASPSHDHKRMYYSSSSDKTMRSAHEGKSPMQRRIYMEGKERHADASTQLHELQEYLDCLAADITEMMKDASVEERAMAHQHMASLVNKITV